MHNLLAQTQIFTPDQGAGGYNAGKGTGAIFTNPFFKGTSLEGLTGREFISKFIPSAIGLLFVFGSLAFFFMFIWGAITWILSGGDKAGVESAKAKVTNALIGLALMIGVFAIVKLIETFFGIDILLIDIGPLIIQ